MLGIAIDDKIIFVCSTNQTNDTNLESTDWYLQNIAQINGSRHQFNFLQAFEIFFSNQFSSLNRPIYFS